MFLIKSKVVILIVFISISLSSCKKVQEVIACADCAQKFAGEKKIKSFIVKDNGNIVDVYDLFYKEGLLDSISHKLDNKSLFQNYFIKLFYAKNACTPSGYIYSRDQGHFAVNASFRTDEKNILEKDILPNNYFYGVDTGNSYLYQYDAMGRVKGRVLNEGGNGGPPEIFVNINYSMANNITGIAMGGDYDYTLDSLVYDNQPNPFHEQANILYYISIFPFNIMRNQIGPGYNIYENLMLNTNNIKTFQYGSIDDGSYPLALYKLVYQYNSDDYPAKIQISAIINETFPNQVVIKKEEIDITYY